MVIVKDIADFLEMIAPASLKLEYDNVGMLLGLSNNQTNKILVSLDITDDVITEAIEMNANVIVSHHPLFFSLKSIVDTDVIGKKVIRMIQNGISAICMHTNLDAATGGVNDVLANIVGIKDAEILNIDGFDGENKPYGIGRFGELENPVNFKEYLNFVKNQLHSNGLRYYDADRFVRKVAVVGGSGGVDMIHAIKNGCDTFITGDVKYDVFLRAREFGINLIDGDHFCTENVIVPILAERLTEAFPEISVLISEMSSQTAEFI